MSLYFDKSKRNTIANIICEYGFSPNDFKLGYEGYNMTDCLHVIHQNTSLTYQIDGEPDSPAFFEFCVCQMGDSQRIKSLPQVLNQSPLGADVYSWEESLDHFSTWLHMLRREENEPDLWEEFAKSEQQGREIAERIAQFDNWLIPDSLKESPLSASQHNELVSRLNAIHGELVNQSSVGNMANELLGTIRDSIVAASSSRPRGVIPNLIMVYITQVIAGMGEESGRLAMDSIREWAAAVLSS